MAVQGRAAEKTPPRRPDETTCGLPNDDGKIVRPRRATLPQRGVEET